MSFKKWIAALTVGFTLLTGSGAQAAIDDNYDVQIIKGSNINLVAQVSRVPILIRNNYDTDVTVLVHVSTSNLRVRLPRVTSVKVAANSTVNTTVPIQAVANGHVELYVWLTSFSGVKLGQSLTVQMQVVSDAEAIALGSLGSIVLALLVVGSIRMVRRRRAES